jgi:hypothetical protein
VPRLIVKRCQGEGCYSKQKIDAKLNEGVLKFGVGLRNNFMDFENYDENIQFKPQYPLGPGLILDPKMT